MQGQATSGTAPEMTLRRGLHAGGLRYRVGVRLLVPGDDAWAGRWQIRPDLLFARSRLVVFVDGCWWHWCPMHVRLPAANREWWRAKLAGNARRDEAQSRALGMAGWTVLRVWEHDLERGCPAELVAFVRAMTRPDVIPVGALLRWHGDGFSCEAIWRVA